MQREEAGSQPSPPSPGGPERRAAPRVPSTLKISCYPSGGGFTERRQARIRNVSRNGIGLTVDRAWPPGTVLVVELPAEDGVKAVRARVIHSTAQLGGTFLVGCTLELPLTDAEVQALGR